MTPYDKRLICYLKEVRQNIEELRRKLMKDQNYEKSEINANKPGNLPRGVFSSDQT